MNFISLLLITTLVCLLSFQTLKKRERAQTQETLLNRVKRLRLYKMLHFLGADQEEFLRAVPKAEVNRLIERCSACSTLDECDRCLRDGHRVYSMSFCPNYKSLCGDSKTVYQNRTQ